MAYRKMTKVSSWRRMAVGMWGRPNNPTAMGTNELDISKTLDFLDRVSKATGQKITVTHLFVAAMGRVLARYPHYNVILRRNEHYERDSCDVFVQVAVKKADGRGDLSGIKIEKADKLTVEEISALIADRANKVRTGKDRDLEQAKTGVAKIPPVLLPAVIRLLTSLSYDWDVDLSFMGIKKDPFGAAMISNVGNFGLTQALVPLLPTSRIGIVYSLGMIQDRPRAVDGKVVVRPTLNLNGSLDHRVLDGYQIGNITMLLTDIACNPDDYPDLTKAFG